MKIIPARREHASEISRLMLEDLRKPDPRFPPDMIAQFRMHATTGITKEFDNKNLIAFVATDDRIIGFIVGYKEGDKATIHYVQGKLETKKALLSHCIAACKKQRLTSIEADTFEFMENNILLQESGMTLLRKEPLTESLDKLWYSISLR